MALLELLDKNELQRLQDEFCRVAGISAYCLDHEGERITRLSGDDRYLHSMKERMAFERVQGEDSIEDLAVEELSGPGQVAALAIQARGEKELYWIVYRPENMSEQTFQDCLELLRDATISFLQGKLKSYSVEAENIRNHSANKKMGRTLQLVQAMAHVVQLLESKEPIEDVMNDWLRVVSSFLELDTAQVFKMQEDGKTMDVICEWRRPGVISFFEKTSRIPSHSFLKRKDSLVIGYDRITDPEYREICSIGLKAVMLFPLCPKEEGTEMVLSLNHRKAHEFDEEEIKFAMDSVRLLEDIMIRRIQKNSLSGYYASLEAILDNVNTCIYIRDERRHKMLYANKQMQNTFGEELKGGTFQWLLEQKGEQREEQSRELYYEAKDRWYDLYQTGIKWVDGSEGSLYSLFDITEKKHYQGRIEQQAYTDFLTGLYNRMCCERDLAIQVDSAKQNGTTGALLYLDLDDFKHINDGLGHQYGDALLKAVSHAFQRIPGIERTCYRMGGDEFVIVVPPEAYEEFEKILEQIQKIFSKPWFLKDSDYYCTMSMGVVTFPENGDSVPDLVKKADIAMYAAKKAGKNRIEFYSNNISSSDRRRLDMEKNMRDATAKNFGEFEVYYQPIIDVSGGEPECAGAEALIRWNSSKLGFVTPVEFIPLAEYLGLINPIGNHVLLEACKQCKEWNDRGFDYKVNVNLSVIQLLQRDIVDIVNNALMGTGLNPEHLTLEVTESLAINDMERMKKILGRIKELGVRIALDDFGTGYSSLNHIREIPFDIIKVDQSFVRDLAEDAYSQSFIKLVSELAQTIGVNICVEGIETAVQHQVLKGMRVKYIQGYYFDRPLSKRDFERRYCRPDQLTRQAPGTGEPANLTKRMVSSVQESQEIWEQQEAVDTKTEEGQAADKGRISGKDRMIGKDRITGKDRMIVKGRSTGKDLTGQEKAGQEKAGQEEAGQEETGQEETGQGKAGQEKAGKEKAGKEKVGKGMLEREMPERESVKSRTKRPGTQKSGKIISIRRENPE